MVPEVAVTRGEAGASCQVKVKEAEHGEPLLPGLSVEVVARMGSTNTELIERVRRLSVAYRRHQDTAAGKALGLAVDFRQTNHEGVLVDAIQAARGRCASAWVRARR